VTEAEGEMQGIHGMSKSKMKWKNIKINEPVDFAWTDVKKGMEEKKQEMIKNRMKELKNEK
jgi:hypothetical protein